MKSKHFSFTYGVFISCMFYIVTSAYTLNSNPNPMQKLEKLLKDYLDNPNNFLTSNNNKDIFTAIFTNFTRSNGEVIYNDYLLEQSEHNKSDLQSIIDDINNIKSKSGEWEYKNGRFNLPDDSK